MTKDIPTNTENKYKMIFKKDENKIKPARPQISNADYKKSIWNKT